MVRTPTSSGIQGLPRAIDNAPEQLRPDGNRAGTMAGNDACFRTEPVTFAGGHQEELVAGETHDLGFNA
jgi:hypothetical protein